MTEDLMTRFVHFLTQILLHLLTALSLSFFLNTLTNTDILHVARHFNVARPVCIELCEYTPFFLRSYKHADGELVRCVSCKITLCPSYLRFMSTIQ